jgi:hypothetical protein
MMVPLSRVREVGLSSCQSDNKVQAERRSEKLLLVLALACTVAIVEQLLFPRPLLLLRRKLWSRDCKAISPRTTVLDCFYRMASLRDLHDAK